MVMKKTAQTKGKSWYSERGTTTEPSEIPGMEKLIRCGKFIALVPIKKEA